MDSHEAYLSIRDDVVLHEVSFGYRTLVLLRREEIEDAQIGYRVDENGSDITGSEWGDWIESWFVIATEDLSGDPVFVDLSEGVFPVYTATHGTGSWTPKMIASSFESFVLALKVVQAAGEGRRNPVQLAENPLSDPDRVELLHRIAGITAAASMDFWEGWLED